MMDGIGDKRDVIGGEQVDDAQAAEPLAQLPSDEWQEDCEVLACSGELTECRECVPSRVALRRFCRPHVHALTKANHLTDSGGEDRRFPGDVGGQLLANRPEIRLGSLVRSHLPSVVRIAGRDSTPRSAAPDAR